MLSQMAGANSRRDLILQSHGGALAPPFPPGSNGGVHRGPDRHPRVSQALLLRTLGEAQVRRVKGPNGKTTAVTIEHAAMDDIVAGLQRIFEQGAKGRGQKHFLKALELMEKAFRNGHEKNGHGASDHQPMPAIFIRSPEAPPISEPSAAAAERAPGVVVANGQEYVAVE